MVTRYDGIGGIVEDILKKKKIVFEGLRLRGYKYDNTISPKQISHVIVLGSAGLPYRFYNYVPFVGTESETERAYLNFCLRKITSNEQERVIIPSICGEDMLPCLGDLLEVFYNN